MPSFLILASRMGSESGIPFPPMRIQPLEFVTYTHKSQAKITKLFSYL